MLIKIWIWTVNVWMIFFFLLSFFLYSFFIIVSLMRFNFYFIQNFVKYYLLLMFLQNLSFDRKELWNDRRHNCFRCSCCCLETKTSRNFEIWSLTLGDVGNVLSSKEYFFRLLKAVSSKYRFALTLHMENEMGQCQIFL